MAKLFWAASRLKSVVFHPATIPIVLFLPFEADFIEWTAK